ncbi:MAG: NAD(P)/FAD-dependent oxidoreductase [Oscillospiraceae bacterium]|nr:NAD(P)/FAD-dependent oxidoreductase [Oscillospiraceae bacterium]
MYDLIIIGGGPAGYRAAELAAGAGLKTLLFEKRALGGVCLNEGCIPSKALLYSAKLYDYAKGGAAAYGVTCQNPILDYAAAVKRKDKVVQTLTAGIEASLKKAGVEIAREHAVVGRDAPGTPSAGIAGRDGNGAPGSSRPTGFTVNGRQARNLLLCTGSEPIIPPFCRGELRSPARVMTSRDILALTEVPETLDILGGGVIGLEMASLFNSAGSKVTVYEMTDKIAGPLDREISAMLQKVYEKKGVTFRLNTRLEAITGPTLVSAGRKPVTAGLEALGLYTENGAIVTDEQMKTNIPNVYAAGDVNGQSMLAHTAYREAEVAVNTIVHAAGANSVRPQTDRMDYSAIPSVIYTNPEAAAIGETLETAQAKGFSSARETKLPMLYSGRFLAENERGEGLCKLVWHDNRLIGAHLLGTPASEVISTLSAILYNEMDIERIQKIIFPHPTVAEIVKEAVFHA